MEIKYVIVITNRNQELKKKDCESDMMIIIIEKWYSYILNYSNFIRTKQTKWIPIPLIRFISTNSSLHFTLCIYYQEVKLLSSPDISSIKMYLIEDNLVLPFMSWSNNMLSCLIFVSNSVFVPSFNNFSNSESYGNVKLSEFLPTHWLLIFWVLYLGKIFNLVIKRWKYIFSIERYLIWASLD